MFRIVDHTYYSCLQELFTVSTETFHFDQPNLWYFIYLYWMVIVECILQSPQQERHDTHIKVGITTLVRIQQRPGLMRSPHPPNLHFLRHQVMVFLKSDFTPCLRNYL
ncbi:uncharacterized protein CANTADRAFT_203933 [Suhomyces tanzawaensis NRRL Y-17324]|uniref:Uncharacterized protein n=1 Tax=Suhomyces tanzawaensis NRRL Y-17324 TaxID=984487 RepID=A0A1E4SP85_9ASCO|nr:uncharacterized protein CANTADRAFT_203933 [Suhomyces tanzawaensis NRRL Y-17324]ODV81306.1 hypothetical protein CANTADRAFT_203933 [Suhomyces tanzawaensis NRRL Y-17324]